MSGYADDLPKGSGAYFRTKDMQTGVQYRLRILSPEPLAGWCGWTAKEGGKPVRHEVNEFAPGEVVPETIKYFRAFAVYDYADNRIKVFEVTQGTITGPIRSFVKDPDYGGPKMDATRFDIKVSKTGSGMETEYQVLPSPPKDMDSIITTLWNEVNAKGFDLREMFSSERNPHGGNPFEPATVPTFDDVTGQRGKAVGSGDNEIPF